jgi:hypothetical protein
VKARIDRRIEASGNQIEVGVACSHEKGRAEFLDDALNRQHRLLQCQYLLKANVRKISDLQTFRKIMLRTRTVSLRPTIHHTVVKPLPQLEKSPWVKSL